MNPTTLSIAQAHQLMAAKQLSPVTLLEACLDQIKKTDNQINASISVLSEQAHLQAEEADKRYRDGESLGVLDGIPISLKDVFCTKGVRTTAASKILANFVPPYDATVVGKLRDKGAVFVSKVNTDEFTCGGSTETSAYGVTKNPWDTNHVSGGSSGGSAASVAAGQCLASLGTDTGGSIRLPAGFCNITGLKVTYGRVSRYGVIPMASSLDTIGPMAKSAEDCAHLLESMAGHDVLDSTTPPQPVPNYSRLIQEPLPKLRIGIPAEYFSEALTPAVKAAVETAAKVIEKIGGTLVPVSLPHTSYAVSVYYIVAPAEISSNMSRYDGIRYGPGPEGAVESLADYYLVAREEGFGDEMKRRILIGSYVLSAGYYDAYYKKAQQVRTLIMKDFDDAFGKVDVLLAPVTPFPAFKIGEKAQDPLQMYLADALAIPSSLAGLPSLALPCGFDGNLPLAMQLIGPAFTEDRILQLGHHYQQYTDFHTRIPSIAS
ncbi:Asp-tRNA(Asn)/Glu-tRNA(Gln) amidotransferase subunit GatA [Candidatus Gracilibacteria bacterium]|nr:Asp-tRNA(Asn)/Glu-tRNA(Gln) amidotransferase subunit GatA [Candidatus Gracilibacteria bacterium]